MEDFLKVSSLNGRLFEWIRIAGNHNLILSQSIIQGAAAHTIRPDALLTMVSACSQRVVKAVYGTQPPRFSVLCEMKGRRLFLKSHFETVRWKDPIRSTMQIKADVFADREVVLL